eukprot:g1647.t1
MDSVKLTSISGKEPYQRSLQIYDADAITSLAGLSGLSGALQGAVQVRGNAKLRNLTGLGGVSSVGTDNNGDSILLHDNPELENVLALEGASYQAGTLYVNNNPKLVCAGVPSGWPATDKGGTTIRAGTCAPTAAPTAAPTNVGDTHSPTSAPTAAPADTPPTAAPTAAPTDTPTAALTNAKQLSTSSTSPSSRGSLVGIIAGAAGLLLALALAVLGKRRGWFRKATETVTYAIDSGHASPGAVQANPMLAEQPPREMEGHTQKQAKAAAAKAYAALKVEEHARKEAKAKKQAEERAKKEAEAHIHKQAKAATAKAYAALKAEIENKIKPVKKELISAQSAKNFLLAAKLQTRVDHLMKLREDLRKLKDQASTSTDGQQGLRQRIMKLSEIVDDGTAEPVTKEESEWIRTAPYDPQADVPFAKAMQQQLRIPATTSTNSTELGDAAMAIVFDVRLLATICKKQHKSRWALLEVVGAGGAGTVVRAGDKKLQTDVALKMVRPAKGNVFGKDEERRLMRESQAMKRVRHSSIPFFHDAFFDMDKTVYVIVMEYVQGDALSEVLQSPGGLSQSTVTKISAELVGAVAAMHAKNIIHLDIKPPNMIYTRSEDGTHMLKIIDFGLAQAVVSDDKKSNMHTRDMTTMMTRANEQAGTLMFMPPEQLEGNELDFRTDVFAIGVTLYQLASGGKFPHRSSCLSGLATLRELDSWREVPPMPLDQLDAEIPADFARIVAKALVIDPTDRYQNAAEMLPELTGLAAETDVAAQAAETRRRLASTEGKIYELFQCPLSEPETSEAFYAICNPIEGTPEEKWKQLCALSDANTKVLDAFFRKFAKEHGFRRVTDATKVRTRRRIQCKWNKKSRESALQKSVRPAILQEWPEYTLAHVRDTLRFKAVVFSAHDAFEFLAAVVADESWTVVKVDIEKFVRPKEWGWRFVGADIKMANGQLVECYVVFAAMEQAKKTVTKAELAQVSNHVIFERWRVRDLQKLSEEEEADFARDKETSTRIYNSAFMQTLNDTTFNEYMKLFADAPQAMRSQANRSWVTLTVDQQNEDQDVLDEVVEI